MIDAFSQQAGQFERFRVHVQDVAARVLHADRASGGGAVEIMARAAALAVIDRVESPAGDRLRRIFESVAGGFQSRHRRIDRIRAGPCAPVRVGAVKVPDIDIAPIGAFRRVAVAFDQPGHEDFVREPGVERIRAPPFEFVNRSGPEDASVPDRDVSRLRPGGIHREDAPGGVDDSHREIPGAGVQAACRVTGGAAVARILAAPLTRSSSRWMSEGTAFPRQATCWSGRESTSL